MALSRLSSFGSATYMRLSYEHATPFGLRLSAPCQEVVLGPRYEHRTRPLWKAILRTLQRVARTQKLKASPEGEALLTSEGRKVRRVLTRRCKRRADKRRR